MKLKEAHLHVRIRCNWPVVARHIIAPSVARKSSSLIGPCLFCGFAGVAALTCRTLASAAGAATRKPSGTRPISMGLFFDGLYAEGCKCGRSKL
jgi:hypothetical protein